MRPSSLMLLGLFCAIVSTSGILILPEQSGGLVVMLFAGGALFGKGCGVYEERKRRRQ